MPEQCSFPLCKQNSYKDGLCVNHNRIYGSAEVNAINKPVKDQKPIKKQSDKMKDAMKDLRKLVKRKLAEQPRCELKLEGCTGAATTAHHSRGRIGKQLLNYKDLMSSCENCNRVCEENDAEARQKGIKKSQHKIE